MVHIKDMVVEEVVLEFMYGVNHSYYFSLYCGVVSLC